MAEQLARGSGIRKTWEECARMKAQFGEDAVCDFTLGNPIAPPPPGWSSALREAVAEDAPGAHRYMDNAGHGEVRRRVASYVQADSGIAVPASNVLMSCGAAGGLNVVLKALLDPGDEVITLAPFFPEYPFYVDNHGGRLCVVETGDDFQPDPQRLAAAITSRTKVVLVNSPNNPTGAVYPAAAVGAIAEVLAEAEARLGHPIYLVADDIYRRIVYDGATVPWALALYPNTIIVNSFSKDLNVAGERIGYVVVSPRAEQAQAILDACAMTTRILGFVNAPSLAQRVVSRCLEASTEMAEYRANRDVLCEAFARAGFRVQKPQGAFYLFPKCPGSHELACCADLRGRGIFVVPGSAFGRAGHFRVAYSVPHQTCLRAAAILSRLA
jgi:aspartate aminotransferase